MNESAPLQALSNNATVGAHPQLTKASGKGPQPLDKLLSDGIVTITPQFAQRIIQEANYARQRPVRPKHVEALATQMSRREWTSGTQIHFAKTSDGQFHLVNGQHRIQAVIKSQMPIQFQILVTAVTSDEQLNALYRRHDRMYAGRTSNDALMAEGIPEKYDLRKEVSRAIFAAVPFILTSFRDVRRYANPYILRSDEARLAFLEAEEYWQIGKLYQDAIGKITKGMTGLITGGTVAIALATLKHQEVKAYPFWEGVSANDMLPKDDPRSAYISYLLTEKVNSQNTLAKAGSIAWNAYFKDEPLTLIRVFATPVSLAGTPFKGR